MHCISERIKVGYVLLYEATVLKHNLGSDVTIDDQGCGAHTRGGMWGISVIQQEDKQF